MYKTSLYLRMLSLFGVIFISASNYHDVSSSNAYLSSYFECLSVVLGFCFEYIFDTYFLVFCSGFNFKDKFGQGCDHFNWHFSFTKICLNECFQGLVRVVFYFASQMALSLPVLSQQLGNFLIRPWNGLFFMHLVFFFIRIISCSTFLKLCMICLRDQ